MEHFHHVLHDFVSKTSKHCRVQITVPDLLDKNMLLLAFVDFRDLLNICKNNDLT